LRAHFEIIPACKIKHAHLFQDLPTEEANDDILDTDPSTEATKMSMGMLTNSETLASTRASSNYEELQAKVIEYEKAL